MIRKFTVVLGIGLVCASLQAAAAAKADVRVYPTPKRIEMTGGFSSVRIADAKVRKAKGFGEEGYQIVVGKSSIIVSASTRTGAFYAKETLKQLAGEGGVPCCIVEDDSDIPLRGVVEGFYGRPWGTDGRYDLIQFMGRHKMNCFIYGPKDDPYHLRSGRNRTLNSMSPTSIGCLRRQRKTM